MTSTQIDNDIWKALGDPTRRELLDLMRDGPRTTGELCAHFAAGLSRFGVMKHLRVLEEAGLVLPRPRGREVLNHLNAVPLQRVHERWVSKYQERTSQALLGLEKHLNQESAMTEFRIEQEISYPQTAAAVFRGLTAGIGSWWPHKFASGAASISLDPRPGGRFMEEGPEVSALYATVTVVEKDKRLVMSGPMGMPGAVLGVISFSLESKGAGTLLKLSHHAFGDVSEELRQRYAAGWTEILQQHLRDFLAR
jgi:DNA-binding transcriptional ArsR family regulator/uncharacterized protein YndB with AHSA1/START domain